MWIIISIKSFSIYPIVLEGVGVVSTASAELPGEVLSSADEALGVAAVVVVVGPLLRAGRSLGLKYH